MQLAIISGNTKDFIDEMLLNEETAQWLHKHSHMCVDDMRVDNELIDIVHRLYAQDKTELYTVTIPDDTTDWVVLLDGDYETLVYVVDGKLYYL